LLGHRTKEEDNHMNARNFIFALCTLGASIYGSGCSSQTSDSDGQEIAVDDDGRIVLEKVALRCVFCRRGAPTVELREFELQVVCSGCVDKLVAEDGSGS
jgi:hypothetical protein